jgi:hypothetical protein
VHGITELPQLLGPSLLLDGSHERGKGDLVSLGEVAEQVVVADLAAAVQRVGQELGDEEDSHAALLPLLAAPASASGGSTESATAHGLPSTIEDFFIRFFQSRYALFPRVVT